MQIYKGNSVGFAPVRLFPFMAFLLIATVVVAAEEGRVKVTAKGWTKIYRGPSQGSSVMAFAKQGDVYPVLMSGSAWVKIQYEEVEGWVARENVTPVGATNRQHSSSRPSPAAKAPSTRAEPPPTTSSTSSTSTRLPERVTTFTARRSPPPPSTTTAIRHTGTSSRAVRQQPRVRTSAAQPRAQRSTTSADTTPEEAIRVFVSHPNVPVLERPDPSARIVGTAVQDKGYVVLEQTPQWIRVELRKGSGWIDREYIMPPTRDERWSLKAIVVGAVLVAAAFLIATLIVRNVRFLWRYYLWRGKDRYRVLVLAHGNKRITDTDGKSRITIARALRRAGFAVLRARELRTVAAYLRKHPPDIMIADWRFGPHVAKQIQALLASRTALSNLPVIFYNVVNTQRARNMLNTKTFYFLDVAFSVRDLFKFTMLLAGNEESPTQYKKSVQDYALEGPIQEGNLIEVLQLIEGGGKSGGLFVDTDGLFGTAYLRDGTITYAATRNSTGEKALEEMLDLKTGYFRFQADKFVDQSNCSIRITAALMEWARKRDEMGR